MGFSTEKMHQADNEKLEKRNNGRNRTAKSGKHLSAGKEGKLKVLVNILSGQVGAGP